MKRREKKRKEEEEDNERETLHKITCNKGFHK